MDPHFPMAYTAFFNTVPSGSQQPMEITTSEQVQSTNVSLSCDSHVTLVLLQLVAIKKEQEESMTSYYIMCCNNSISQWNLKVIPNGINL